MLKIAVVIETFGPKKKIGNIYYGIAKCADNSLDSPQGINNVLLGKTYEMIRNDKDRTGLIRSSAYDSADIEIINNKIIIKENAVPISSVWVIKDSNNSMAELNFESIAEGIGLLYTNFCASDISENQLIAEVDDKYIKETTKYVINGTLDSEEI